MQADAPVGRKCKSKNKSKSPIRIRVGLSAVSM
jgi:hypothetical protein